MAAEKPSDVTWLSKEGLPRLKLFAGNANPQLAQAVADYLGIPVGKAIVGRFNDGEINIQVQENVRNADVYLLQSTCKPVNDHLMELYLLIRTLKRASAGTVTAIIPYFGYARQDRKLKARVPISASDTAILLEAAGVDRVVSVDLHCGQIQGFFHRAPVDNLLAVLMFVPYFATLDMQKIAIISPDAGGVSRAKSFMHGLQREGKDCSFAMVIKQRAAAGVVESMTIIGEEVIDGADCIIVDDIADTCGTLCAAVETLRKKGARRVFACIAHPVFSKDAIQKVEACDALHELVVTDTIEHENLPAKVRVLSVARMIGEAVKRIHLGESVSSLFDD